MNGMKIGGLARELVMPGGKDMAHLMHEHEHDEADGETEIFGSSNSNRC